jgi:hypothetical protein
MRSWERGAHTMLISFWDVEYRASPRHEQPSSHCVSTAQSTRKILSLLMAIADKEVAVQFPQVERNMTNTMSAVYTT